MRAMRIHAFGDPSVIRDDDVPVPEPGRGEVLLRVAATSFNPSDLGVRRGLFPLDLPYTPGAEVAGTVTATGADVARFSVGDRVVGRIDGGGAAADFVVAPAEVLVAAPVAVPWEHAAALPVAGLTAWQAVFEHAAVRPGQRVLVNGAGGGVGGFAVQLAKHAGAYVTATAGPRSAAAVRGQGADRVVDYTAGPVAAAVDGPVDVLLHLVAGDAAALVPLVRPGGTVVSVTVPVEVPTGVTAVRFVARNDRRDLAGLVALVDAGVVRIDVSARRPLTDLAAVHRDAEAGRTRGKIILTP